MLRDLLFIFISLILCWWFQAEHGPDNHVVLVIAEDGVDVGPSRRRSACRVRVFLEEILLRKHLAIVSLCSLVMVKGFLTSIFL